MINFEVGRAVLYQRVSSASQTGPKHVSLGVQDDYGQEFVNGNGGQVVGRFVDPAQSGGKPNRVQYMALIEMCRNREVDTVVVYMLDRIGRNIAEYAQLMQRFKAWGVRLHSVQEPYLTDNPALGFKHMIDAQEEATKIGMRVKPAHQKLLEAGLQVGRAARGYKIIDDVSKPSRDGREMLTGHDLEPNVDAAAVTELFELYAGGEYGIKPLDRVAATLFGRRMGSSQLNSMLRNPVYLGFKVWGRHKKDKDEFGLDHVNLQPASKWFVGDEISHKPLVTREVWDRVQQVLDRNRAKGDPTPRGRQLLVGMIFCACGSRMSAHPNRGKAIYICQRRRDLGREICDQPSVSAPKLNPLVKAQVEAALAPLADPNLRDLVLDRLAAKNEEELAQKHSHRRQLEASRTRFTNDLAKATARMIREEITRDEFELVAPGWKSQLAGIEAELADLPEESTAPDYGVTLRQLQLKNIDWHGMTDAGWREFLQATVERVTLVAGTPRVEFKDLVHEAALEMAAIRI